MVIIFHASVIKKRLFVIIGSPNIIDRSYKKKKKYIDMHIKII